MTQTEIDFDVCAAKHQANPESTAANTRVNKSAARQEVYDALVRWGDMTCKEIAQRLGKPMHKVSGRLTELKALGMVAPTDEVRDGGRVMRAVREGTL